MGPVINQTNRRMGMHELTAVMGYLRNYDEMDSVLNTTVEKADNYSDFDLQLGKFLYSRPAGNKTPDINP